MHQAHGPRRRTLWLFVGIVFLLGVSGGLLLTWGVWPVDYFDTDPVDLRAELKQDYLVLIGSSFAVEDDLEHARQRLSWLGFNDEDASRVLIGLTKRYVEGGGNVAVVRGLSKLAYGLGVRDSQILVYVVTPTATVTPTPTATSTPTITMTPTDTPLAPTLLATPSATSDSRPTARPATDTPTPTATPVPVPAYQVVSKSFACKPLPDVAGGVGVLEVHVEEAGGSPQAGVALSIAWGDELDVFFSGLKPDKGAGYADFTLQPGARYVLRVDDNQSEPVAISLRDGECAHAAETQPVPVWQVVFRKRETNDGG